MTADGRLFFDRLPRFLPVQKESPRIAIYLTL